MSSTPRRSASGFTLIELLVVIAIIAILASILFPVFAQARAKARAISCISNFKQEALGIQMYIQDTDGTYPINSYTGSYSAKDDSNWGLLVQPYIKNYQIFQCPSDPIGETGRMEDLAPPSAAPGQREFNLAVKNDFAMNWQYLSAVLANPDRWVPTQESAIGSPASMILGVDSVWDRTAGGTPRGGGNNSSDPPCKYYADGTSSFPAVPKGQPAYWFTGWNPSQPLSGVVFGANWPWHGERCSVAFTDGHAKALTISQLSAGCNVKDSWGGVIFDKDAYLWDTQ